MNLSAEQSFREIISITTPMEKEIVDECRHHFCNEVSAHILQRKFHECRVMEHDCWADMQIEKINTLKSNFIEKYATHADFEKGIAIHDVKIAEILDTKNQSFEQFVALRPNFREWRCYSYMAVV